MRKLTIRCSCLVFLGSIVLVGFLSWPRIIMIEVKKEGIDRQATVLDSRMDLNYKIPFDPLFSMYQLVDNLGVRNSEIIKKLIKCESWGDNVSRPDSDGIISDGILQYHRDKKTPDVMGSGTWAEFSRQSGIKGSPTNPPDAIRQTDWAIDNGKIGRWSCYWILKRKGLL